MKHPHPTVPDDGTRFMGIFLMALWSLAMVVFTGDLAASDGTCTGASTCAWTGLSGLHTFMQAVLLLAAIGAGATGASLWISSDHKRSQRQREPARHPAYQD
jgi:hypothetical protein